jgi:zinc and cadmium transporter
MDERFWITLGATLLAASFTALGIMVIRRYETWGRGHTGLFMSFAAGVLIGASFLHIVPASLQMNLNATVFLLAGFFGLHLINHWLTAFVCERDPGGPDISVGLIPLLGIGLHSFVDGMVYSVTFTVDLITGTLAALGMVLHEFPEGIVTYLLLLRGGYRPHAALWLAVAAAGLSTPLGMLISYPLVSGIEGEPLGALLALSAGALVYVGATHLLPQALRERQPLGLVAFTAGLAVAVSIVVGHH